MVSLRDALKVYWEVLHDILMSLFRSGKDAQEATLRWVGAAVKINMDRKKMQFDPRAVSTDGFIMNLQSVMLMVCEPFCDPRSKKLNSIDPSYVSSKHRMDLTDETRLAIQSDKLD